MTANIVQLDLTQSAFWHWSSVSKRQALGRGRLTKPSGVTSVAARPPALSPESTINHDGPFCVEQWSVCAVGRAEQCGNNGRDKQCG